MDFLNTIEKKRYSEICYLIEELHTLREVIDDFGYVSVNTSQSEHIKQQSEKLLLTLRQTTEQCEWLISECKDSFGN